MQPIIIHQDSDLLVINKPPFMAVAKPYHQATLEDYLFEHKLIDPSLFTPEQRSGIIHRLDADTSGLIFWAKNPATQEKLKLVWQSRSVAKTYLALVDDAINDSGTIELSIIRDNKKDKQKIDWSDSKGRVAITTYTKIGEGRVGDKVISLIKAHPITGRTHQLRVHLSAIGHPIIGDDVYGTKSSQSIAKAMNIDRQFLHSYHTVIPEVGEWTAELWPDLKTAQKAYFSDIII